MPAVISVCVLWSSYKRLRFPGRPPAGLKHCSCPCRIPGGQLVQARTTAGFTIAIHGQMLASCRNCWCLASFHAKMLV